MSAVFEKSSLPTALRPKQPLPAQETPPTLDELLDEGTWIAWRDRALQPQDVTDLYTDEQTRAEFIAGARLLRLDAPGKFVKPHQLVIADMINAGKETNGVLVPRRSSKTTSIAAVALGRCQLREDYQAALTLTTTAAKTSERFTADIFGPIERAYPDPTTRPVRVFKGKGSERLEWANGSRFYALTPNGDAFRSSAYDFVVVDESGEATVEQGEDLNGAIYPTFDTRPGAQVVFAGTAGDYRDGLLLWDALHNPDAGRLAYRFPDDLTEDELAAWEPSDEHPYARVRELVETSHPGVHSGLTTLETVRKRFGTLKAESFTREYGGVFGSIGEGRGVINAQRWAESGRSLDPVVPERFAMAVVPAFTQGSASIVAAWRDEQGRAHGYVLDHRRGTTWLADAAASKARQHNLPIVYDSASSTMRLEVEQMNRMSPRPRLEPQTTANVTTAAALLVREVNNGNAIHYKQPPMDDASKAAVRRSVGASAWALGRPPKNMDADISALEAWAMALRYYDDNPVREHVGPIMGH